MKIQLVGSCFLFFTETPPSWGILIDPKDQWEVILSFTKKNKVQIRYILLTKTSFENALWVSTIKQETGAKFLSFQADLFKLQQLPTLANQANVCGVKIPHVDRFLDGLSEIEIDGIRLQITTSNGSHEYVIDGHRIPPSKVETQVKME